MPSSLGVPTSLFLKLFVGFGLPFGVLSAAIKHSDSATEFVVFAVVAGSAFGAWLATTVGRRVVRANRENGQEPGHLGVRCERSIEIAESPEKVLASAAEALRALPGIRSVRSGPDSGALRGTTAISWHSWSERVTVRVAPKSGGSLVTVRSVPWLPLTIVDYGKNRRNVKAILDALGPSAPGPLKGHC